MLGSFHSPLTFQSCARKFLKKIYILTNRRQQLLDFVNFTWSQYFEMDNSAKKKSTTICPCTMTQL